MTIAYLPSSSGTYSYNGGKYRFKLDYSYSANGFTFTGTITITNATNSKHYFNMRWKDENGVWQTAKSTSTYKAKKSHSFGARMTTATKLEVQMQFGGNGWKSFGAISPPITVYTPNISAELLNDSLVNLKVTGYASAYSYVNKILIERSEDNGSWSSIAEITDSYANTYEVNYDDMTVTAGHRYQYRAKAYKDSSESIYSAETPWIYTTPTSGDVSGSVSASRLSNSSVKVQWALNSVTPVQLGNVKQFILTRSTNGGAYEDLQIIDAVTSTTNYSATDSSCTKDNTYRYAIDIINSSGVRMYSPLQSDNVIRMTPTEPQGLSLALDSDNIPVLTITNTSNSATDVLIERKENNGSWTQETSLEYPVGSYEGAAVEAGETVYYRIRNYTDDSTITPASDRYSGYVLAGAGGGSGSGGISVDTKSKPNPPTLISPISGANYTLDEGTIRLEWSHNATDGSAQESARVMYKINNGSYTTVTVTTARYYNLNITGRSANDVITWKVATKGAHADYSDYSSEKTFKLLSKPQISFTSPANAAVISSLPIVLAWNYSDLSGRLASLKVNIKKGNETVYTVDVPVGSGQSGSYNYTLTDFLPDNETQYSINAVALSSSGLSASQSVNITVRYTGVVLTGGLLPSVFFDEETGYATIQIMRDITEGASPLTITNAFLYRVHDGETSLVESGINEGSTVIDKYAPVNVDYVYKLLQVTSGGIIGIAEVDIINPTGYWYVLWGDNVAKAKWNPKGTASIDRPDRTEVRYSGRRFPVSYDSNAEEEAYAFSASLTERADLNMFIQMMRDGGQGIWKSGDGECYNANFKFDYSANFEVKQRTWECSLDVKRIE